MTPASALKSATCVLINSEYRHPVSSAPRTKSWSADSQAQQPDALGVEEIAHPRRFDCPERLHAPPRIVARNGAGNSIRGGAALA
jgi:hypothetical protein